MHARFWIGLTYTMLVLCPIQAEDLQAVASPTPEKNTASPGLFDMVDSYEAQESDWRQWPITTHNRAARIETTVLHIVYPYRDQKFNVYAYQLPNGGAGRPWITYIWVDRGMRFQTENTSPTPIISCPDYNSDRWRGIEDITNQQWKEIEKISTKISELPLEGEKKTVSAKRISITQRTHPYPSKLAAQGGVSTIHELTWTDGKPLTVAPANFARPTPK